MQFFIESIAHDRTFTAFLCDNFEDFKDGMCLSSSRMENMGLDWQEQNSIQGRRDFTITRREAPFSGETGSFSYSSIFTEGKNATIIILNTHNISGKQVKITMTFSKSSTNCDALLDDKDDEGHGTVYVTLISGDGSMSEQIEMGR